MVRTFGLVLVLIAFGGCGGNAGDLGLPDRPPDFEGVVRDVEGPKGDDVVPRSILVVPAGDACGFWTVVEDAEVVDVDVQVEPSVIEQGRRARVWVDGPIAESCPAQTSAGTVELLPD